MTEGDGVKGEDGWVVTRRRVIYGDTDAMGIVYYGNYLRFLEIGRVELLRVRGRAYSDIEAAGYVFPVAEVNVRYMEPARYDDVIAINARVEELGRVTLRFRYRLIRERDGVLLAKGFTRHACVRKETLQVTRLPKDLVALLQDPAA